MKKKFLIIILLLLLLVGCNKKEETESKETNNTTQGETELKENNNTTKGENKMETNNIKITINNQEYDINLENNDTVRELKKMLPLNLTMTELNGNEKYIYLDSNLPTNSYNPKTITKGDVMLYGNNCLVIFYKSFNTNYSYTKIGHINNLGDLGKGSIEVTLE